MNKPTGIPKGLTRAEYSKQYKAQRYLNDSNYYIKNNQRKDAKARSKMDLFLNKQVSAAKARALSKGKEWGFETLEEARIYFKKVFVKQNGKCDYSHRKLTTRGHNLASPDRIDSKKGYIKGNICWVTARINKQKGESTKKAFLNECALITKIQVRKSTT